MDTNADAGPCLTDPRGGSPGGNRVAAGDTILNGNPQRRRPRPSSPTGSVEAIDLVKIARDTVVKAHSVAMIALKATLVTAWDERRAGARAADRRWFA